MPSLYQGKFDPKSTKNYKISRSKIELFKECKRCFYLDRRYAFRRPPSFPFNLNSAVDNLLKNEFDIYRESQSKHPLQANIDAIPFQHKELNIWRENFKGVSCLHETGLYLFGAVDDVWVNSQDELIVVDYKATSKNDPITHIDEPWQISYKRQMEFYQYLFKQNGFKVSNTGYFVYCNGKRNEKRFDKKLDFKISLIPYEGNDSWVDDTIHEVHDCLTNSEIPESSGACPYCKYVDDISLFLKKDLDG